MTTATTVVGLLPLVLFGDGPGTNIWDALALVLIGGLLSSTIFVLTITPAVYNLLERSRVARTAHPSPPAEVTAPVLSG
jgi:HAE1 family hydrophobic/amphiphilic exporter-1